MTWEGVADRVFRRNAAWLHENLPADFPQSDPVHQLFHVGAMEAWARRRWGVVAEASSPEGSRECRRRYGPDRARRPPRRAGEPDRKRAPQP